MTDQTVQPPTETIAALAEQGVDELQTILDALRGQPADSTATTENFSDDEGPRVVLIAAGIRTRHAGIYKRRGYAPARPLESIKGRR